MKKLFSLLLCCVTITLVFSQKDTINTFTFQDSLREYHVYLPQSYLDNPSQEVPLLFNIHGYGSNKEEQQFYGNFINIADTENFIICHPDGTKDDNGDLFWDAGFGADIDDVAFISALIDTLETNYNIDSTKIYSTGMSNGGYMSLTLACELSDKIKKVASVTGSMTPLQSNNCSNTSPIPVLQISGTADATVTYNPSTTQIGAEAVVDFWVNHNNCSGTPTISPVENINTSDNSTAERFDYSMCDENSAVVFYKVIGGGHTWPGALFNIPGYVTNKDFNASHVIWQFFEPSYEIPTSISSFKNDFEFSVYPNPIQDKLAITIPTNHSFIKMELLTITGQSIFVSEKQEMITSNLENGIYILRVSTNKGIAAQKIVKN